MEHWEIAILAVVVLGVLGIDILMIIQLRRKGFKHYFLAIIIGSIIAAILTPVALFVHLEPKEWVELIFTVILVSITGFYAISATKQADANEKMASEMQNQRYDLLRPVINIEVSKERIAAEDQRMFYANSTEGAKELPNEIACVLHNVGVGPATDVYSYFRIVGGDEKAYQERSLGPISKDDKSSEKLLALLKRGQCNGLLLVIYRDAYGRYFASRREIYSVAAESGLKLEVGPLDAFKLPRKGKPKTYEDVQKAIQEELKDVEMPTI
jgi:hypothetical protein